MQTDDENVWRLDLDGQRPPATVLDSTWIDTNPSLSRDGEYLAFRSARTGSSEMRQPRLVSRRALGRL
jgi:Tol biopolymer transport system component